MNVLSKLAQLLNHPYATPPTASVRHENMRLSCMNTHRGISIEYVTHAISYVLIGRYKTAHFNGIIPKEPNVKPLSQMTYTESNSTALKLIHESP